MVTAVTYRKVLLNARVEACIRETLKGISNRYEIIIDEVGFDQNHIHIFCGALPRAIFENRLAGPVEPAQAMGKTQMGCSYSIKSR